MNRFIDRRGLRLIELLAPGEDANDATGLGDHFHHGHDGRRAFDEAALRGATTVASLVGVATSPASAEGLFRRTAPLFGRPPTTGSVLVGQGLERGRRDLQDVESDPGSPLGDECACNTGLMLIGLRSGERNRGRRDSVVGSCAVRCGIRSTGHDGKNDLELPVCGASLGFGMFSLPAGTADRAADPFRGGGLRYAVALGDAVPRDKGVVALDPDAGVRAYLGLEYARGRAGALCESAGALLEEIEGIEGYLAGISTAAVRRRTYEPSSGTMTISWRPSRDHFFMCEIPWTSTLASTTMISASQSPLALSLFLPSPTPPTSCLFPSLGFMTFGPDTTREGGFLVSA